MLLTTAPFTKRFFLSSRFYHHNSRYDGYWTLLLQKPTSVLTTDNNVHSISLDTTNNDHEVTGSAMPIKDAPTSTQTSNDGSDTSAKPRFVWLQNEKISLPEKPPPPENCCMSGCAYCVYDIYQEDMETYKHDMNKLRQRFVTANVDLPEALQTKKNSPASQADTNDDDDDDMDPTMKAFLEMEKKLNAKH